MHKHKHGRLHPFHREGAEQPIADALELLAELHRTRNYQPFAATVHALLEATRAHAGFLLRPGGNQILANVARVADLARTYEMTGGVSFRGFVEELTGAGREGRSLRSAGARRGFRRRSPDDRARRQGPGVSGGDSGGSDGESVRARAGSIRGRQPSA